jgi:trehalose 6-phosphate synthase/phosphatase
MPNPAMIVASNRLPYSPRRDDEGWTLVPSSGGLATALRSFCGRHSGVWVGWPGVKPDNKLKRILQSPIEGTGFRLSPVVLTEDEKQKFYGGFSNEVIWPLFHDLPSRCRFDPAYWQVYRRVNDKFAEAIAAAHTPETLVWVHDYHLMLTAQQLRVRGLQGRFAYFHHIPFPGLDIYEKLPWRREILEGLLAFGLIGLQSERDLENLSRNVQRLLPGTEAIRNDGFVDFLREGRWTRAGAFPIAIDYDEFADAADTPEIAERALRLREELRTKYLVLGVDRLDYTKGLVERLLAYRTFLDLFPQMRGQVTLVQVAVPSREALPKYRELRLEVERLVSKINGKYTQPGWVPIHYLYRSLERADLLAYYRAADVALVTPLKDGMNLVAKEYCAAQVEGNGALVLSEFAGAAAQSAGEAILVNPFDLEGVARAIQQACQMAPIERRSRMARLRESVRIYDVRWWADAFLSAVPHAPTADGRGVPLLGAAPTLEVPSLAAPE